MALQNHKRFKRINFFRDGHLDARFVAEMSVATGLDLAVFLPGRVRMGGLEGITLDDDLSAIPVLAERKADSETFRNISNGDFVLGVAQLRTSDGQSAYFVFGQDKERLAAGLTALERAVYAVLGFAALILVPAAVIYLNRVFLNPIGNLLSGVESLRGGNYRKLSDFAGTDELSSLAGSFNEMSQAIQAREDALRESERQLRLITDSLPVLITRLDTEQRYLFVNKTAAQWFNQSADQVLGKTIKEVIGEAGHKNLKPSINRMLTGQQSRSEKSVTYPDGVKRHVDIIFVPDIASDGTVMGAFGLATDITERKQLEEQIRRSQKMEAMGTLVGGLAHEMNNIMQPIGGLADIALKDPTNEETVVLALEGIKSSSQKADEILQGMLAFGRREQAAEDKIDLKKALSDALHVIGPSLPPTIQIKEEIESDVGQTHINGTEFMQVVLNLIKNASDAMEGDGTVSLSLKCAAPASGDTPNPRNANQPRAVLTVADRGPGIPKDVINRIFEPFYTTKKVGEGTGLGLAITYNIVTDWGGDIRVQNVETGGAEFEVSIPLV